MGVPVTGWYMYDDVIIKAKIFPTEIPIVFRCD